MAMRYNAHNINMPVTISIYNEPRENFPNRNLLWRLNIREHVLKYKKT